MEFMVLIDPTTPAGAYFVSTPPQIDSLVTCGVTSGPVLRCTSIDWDSKPGFVRLIQAASAQKNRAGTSEWLLPNKCIALVLEISEPDRSAVNPMGTPMH